MIKRNRVNTKALNDNCKVDQPDPLPDGSAKIELTRGLFTFFDEKFYDIFSNYRWYAVENHNTCYCHRFEKIDGKQITIKMHREILGLTSSDKRVVDHINGNGLDNRLCNLRIISHAENIKAQPKRRAKPKSKYIGVVYRVSEPKKWLARVRINNLYKKIGYYDTEIEAAKAYDAEEFRVFGGNSDLNFKEDYLNNKEFHEAHKFHSCNDEIKRLYKVIDTMTSAENSHKKELHIKDLEIKLLQARIKLLEDTLRITESELKSEREKST